jgi:hypothetical protein
MAAVHPKLTEELVRQLLDEGEHAGLDYKAMLNIAETAELVAVAKDIGAMQSLPSGGFLIVGANDDGSLSGALESAHVNLLDESRLRAKLTKYLPDPIQLVTRLVEIDDEKVVVIHVAPHPAGFATFKADGNYPRPDGKQGCEFRAGDVFTRRGTSSARCQQSDWERIIEEVVASRKESWRRELAQDLSQLGISAQGQRIAQGPAAAVTWQLDADAFAATTVELLRANDTIPLNLLIDRLTRDARPLLQDADRADDAVTLLDRTAALAAIGLALGRSELFDQALAVLLTIYNYAFDQYGYPSQALAVPASSLWLMIVERVLALGGLAVRRRNWRAVRMLALQKGRGNDFSFYNNWIRHGLTMAARDGRLDRQEGGTRIEVSLVQEALELARGEEALRPDLSADDDALLDSICQFDALAAFAAFDDAGSADGSHYYPNFARFNWMRSEPAVVALIEDDAARAAVFPRPNDELAAAIRSLAQLARGESLRYRVIDDWESKPVVDFLQGASPPVAD